MTLLDQRPRADPSAGSDAEALFKEARRRRRRLRLLWVGIALAVVGCAVGLGFGFHVLSGPANQPRSAGSRALAPGHLHTGATLVYALNDLRVIDADTGATRILPMPAPYGGSRDLGMARVGGSLLFQRGNTAWLYSDGVTGSPTDLGPSDGVFPGPNRNEAWVWSQPCQPPFGCADYRDGPQMGTVRLVDSSGQTIGSPVQLPGGAGWHPTGLAGSAGIVLRGLPPYGRDNTEEIWNPLTNRVVRVISNAQVIGAAGNLVVSEPTRYCSGKFAACSVRVTNLRTGTDKTVLLPKGLSITGDAAISANHRTIALTTALSRTARIPYPKGIVLIDVRTDDATILPGSRQTTNPNGGPMSLTWSTNGWLFSDTVGSPVVHAWQPGQGRASVLPNVRLPQVQLINEDPSLIAL